MPVFRVKPALAEPVAPEAYDLHGGLVNAALNNSRSRISLMTKATGAAMSQFEFDTSYRVAGWSMLRMTPDEIAPLRKATPGFFPPNVAPISLKHCDEQTVVGLAAIFRAIDG